MIDWDGRARQACPACDKGGRDTALRIWSDRGNAFCHRCGEKFYRDEPNDGGKTRQICRVHQEANLPLDGMSPVALALWDGATSVRGTVAEEYLTKARRVALPPDDTALRFHPALRHPSGYVGPALLALAIDPITNAPMTLHRTWITAHGKAEVNPPRLLAKGCKKAGSVIKLWGDDYVTHGLAIGEGIETCLALALMHRPVWCCIDAGNLAAFPVLPGIEVLTIAVDHDDAGIKAANECAARWDAAGRTVFMVKAEQPGFDLADLTLEAA